MLYGCKLISVGKSCNLETGDTSKMNSSKIEDEFMGLVSNG